MLAGIDPGVKGFPGAVIAGVLMTPSLRSPSRESLQIRACLPAGRFDIISTLGFRFLGTSHS